MGGIKLELKNLIFNFTPKTFDPPMMTDLQNTVLHVLFNCKFKCQFKIA